MRGFIWLAVLSGSLMAWQSAWATSIKYDVRSGHHPVANTETDVARSVTTPVTFGTRSVTGNPLLSSLTSRRSELTSTTLVSHDGYTPEPLVHNRNRHTPTAPPTPPTTAKGGKPASVPDTTATAGLLGIGFFGTVLAKRKLAKPGM